MPSRYTYRYYLYYRRTAEIWLKQERLSFLRESGYVPVTAGTLTVLTVLTALTVLTEALRGSPQPLKEKLQDNTFNQEYTNPGRQVAWTTKFCTVVPNICGASVWNFLHVVLPVPKTFDMTPRGLKKYVHPSLKLPKLPTTYRRTHHSPTTAPIDTA
jgi:hypothetical protein